MKHIFTGLATLSLLFLVGFGFFHTPASTTTLVTITEPEIFQAYSTDLGGAPMYYGLEMDTEFSLYLGLLVPEINQEDADVSVQVYRVEEELGTAVVRIDAASSQGSFVPLFTLDGISHNWQSIFASERGEYFLQGPEIFGLGKTPEGRKKGVTVPAGTYVLRVSSRDNFGPYVLVLGEKDRVFNGDRVVRELGDEGGDGFGSGNQTMSFLFLVLFFMTLGVLTCVWVMEFVGGKTYPKKTRHKTRRK